MSSRIGSVLVVVAAVALAVSVGASVSSGTARATSASCGTGCVEEFAPYAQGSYSSDVTQASGSGWNAYSYGPYVLATVNGEIYVDQQSGATYSGDYTEWTYLTIEGQPITISHEEYVQFLFQLSASWSWNFNVDCLIGGVSGGVGAAWQVGLIGYPQYTQEVQLFADDTSAPCFAFSPNHTPAASVTPDQGSGSGSGLNFLEFQAYLPAGTYTPAAQLVVLTSASTAGLSTITSTVDMGDPGYAEWDFLTVDYSYPVGGCFIGASGTNAAGLCWPVLAYAPGQTMQMTIVAPTSTDPISVQAFINGVGASVHPWSVSGNGWTYTIDFGGAPNLPGTYSVYALVTFSGGSTATTNTCSVTIT
jgi:hypothetical protein